MSEYKRLTRRDKDGNVNVPLIYARNILDRLADLEDEIESGLLIKIGYCKDCSHCVEYDSGLYCPYYDCGTEPDNKCGLFSKRKPKPKQSSKS